MRPELERIYRIEQYLLGTLPACPTEEWAVQQVLDAELEADTQTQQLTYRALYAAGRRQLRQELQLIHEQLYAPRTSRWHWLKASSQRAIRSWLRLRRKH